LTSCVTPLPWMVSCAGPGSTSSMVKRPAWMTVTLGSPVTAKALPGLKSRARTSTVPSVGTLFTDAKLPVIMVMIYSYPSSVAALGGLLATRTGLHAPGKTLHRQARPLRATPPATSASSCDPHIHILRRLRRHPRRHERQSLRR